MGHVQEARQHRRVRREQESQEQERLIDEERKTPAAETLALR